MECMETTHPTLLPSTNPYPAHISYQLVGSSSLQIYHHKQGYGWGKFFSVVVSPCTLFLKTLRIFDTGNYLRGQPSQYLIWDLFYLRVVVDFIVYSY